MSGRKKPTVRPPLSSAVRIQRLGELTDVVIGDRKRGFTHKELDEIEEHIDVLFKRDVLHLVAALIAQIKGQRSNPADRCGKYELKGHPEIMLQCTKPRHYAEERCSFDPSNPGEETKP